IAGCAQALEVLEEVRLNRCAIGLQGKSEELVERDTTVGRVLDHRADRIAQWISLRASREGDVTLAQQVVDVACAGDNGSAIERPPIFPGQSLQELLTRTGGQCLGREIYPLVDPETERVSSEVTIAHIEHR